MSFAEMADLVRAVERETKASVVDATYRSTGSGVDLRVHADPENYAAAWVSIPLAMAPFVDRLPVPFATSVADRLALSSFVDQGDMPMLSARSVEDRLAWAGERDKTGVVVSIPLDPRAVLDDVAEHLGWDIIANTGTTATIVEAKQGEHRTINPVGVHTHLDPVSGLLTFVHESMTRTAELSDGLDDVAVVFAAVTAEFEICEDCGLVRRIWTVCEGADLCEDCGQEHAYECRVCRADLIDMQDRP